jgi:proton-coupled amino acid transporter
MSKNTSRSILVVFTIVFTILLGDNLDYFLSTLGAVSCTPVAFTLPALYHLKAVANTRCQKITDISIILVSLVVFVGITLLDVEEWIKAV